jgi:hypothetical protein
MNRRPFLIGGAIAVALVVVLGVLYYLGGRNGGETAGSFLERLAKGVTSVTQTMTPAEMAASPEFAFHRLDIDTSQAQAQACLVFTRPLDITGKTHYEDYLTVDPKTRIVVRPLDQRLCIGGLDFNQTYNMTLKTGFPDAAGDKLVEEETVPVELRDKPALVRFSGGIVLPRDNADGVPVTTINIDKLKLEGSRSATGSCRRSKAVSSTKRLFIPGTRPRSKTTRAPSSGPAPWMWRTSRTTRSSRSFLSAIS